MLRWLRRGREQRYERQMAEQYELALTLGLGPDELAALRREASARAPRIRR